MTRLNGELHAELLPSALRRHLDALAQASNHLVFQGAPSSGKHSALHLLRERAPKHAFLSVNLGDERARLDFEQSLLDGDLRGLSEGLSVWFHVNGLEHLSAEARFAWVALLEKTQENPQRMRVIAFANCDLPTSADAQLDSARDFFEARTYHFKALSEQREEAYAFLQTLMQTPLQMDERVQSAMAAWSWPGGLRELAALADRLAPFSSHLITLSDLPREIQLGTTGPPQLDLDALLLQTENRYLEWAMRVAKGNQSAAARLLAMSPSRFQRRYTRLLKANRQKRRDARHEPGGLV
jgi:hypothetical protein